MEYRQEQQARRSSATPATGLGAGLEAELTSIGFARLARGLVAAAARSGVVDVTFRSPGRVGVGRAIRRNADGSATIAVRYRGRPAMAVAADMIEGVVRAAKKGALDVEGRDGLWRAAGEILIAAPSSDSNGAEGGAVENPGSASDGRSHSSAARQSAAGSGFTSSGRRSNTGRDQSARRQSRQAA